MDQDPRQFPEGEKENGEESPGETSSEASPSPPLLQGMTPQQAKEYVTAQIATARQYRKQLDELNEEIDKWKKRCRLAEEKGAEDLLRQAEQRVDELEQKQTSLQADLWEVEMNIPSMKKELEKMVAYTPSVDANALLSQLENIVGKDRVTERKVEEELQDKSVDDELSALKARLKKEKDDAVTNDSKE